MSLSWKSRAGTYLLAVLMVVASKRGMAAEARPEGTMRGSVCLNGMWEVAPATEEVVMPKEGWAATRVPAVPIVDKNVKELWCRLVIEVPKEWGREERRFFLEFEKVGHYAAVFCN